MAAKGLCLLALLAAVGAAGVGSPVTKVVELIKELKAKIEVDGKAEQKIYNKYACWCESTSERKATAIHQAMADIKSHGTSVLEYKGSIATYSSEINELGREIQDNQQAQDEATGIRQRENGEYEAQKAEMEQTLNALERGIKVLMGAGTGGDESLLQTGNANDEMKLLLLAKDVHEAVQKLPVDHLLTPASLAQLTSFTTTPADYLDQKAKKSSSFSPQSATIQGILKDMYDTFSMNLEKATETEATQQKNYETLSATKSKEMQTLTETRTAKEGHKAEAEKNLADASQELDDTTVQMKADTALFDDTKAACTAKAAEWNERVRARSEEMAGINKGLEILTSDEARAMFTKAIKPGMEAAAFFQESSVADSQPAMKAYNKLKAVAMKTKSLRLAQIAAQLRTGGHFDAVIVEIDKMIAVHKEDEQDDIEQRDWCKEETFKNEQEAARYEYKVEKHNTKIMKLTKKLEDLEVSKQQTIAAITDTREDIATMESTRIEEHNSFEGAKSDDEQASALLAAAIEAMSAFYKNNAIDQGEIQGGAKAALVQAPEFEVSEDQAPDASFSSAGKSGGESKGIISLMTMIKEDLDDEVKNGVKNEKKNQASFEKAHNAAHKLLEDLLAKKTNLETSIADTNKEINDETIEKEGTQSLLDEEREYLASIKPDCDWILKEFTPRRETRGEEVQALIEAKGMLAGAAPPAMLETSKGKFDDDEFDSLRLRSVSFLQKQ